MNYLVSILTALSRMLNALLGGSSSLTLSSRAWYDARDGKRVWLRDGINALFFWQIDHCLIAVEWDEYLNLQANGYAGAACHSCRCQALRSDSGRTS